MSREHICQDAIQLAIIVPEKVMRVSGLLEIKLAPIGVLYELVRAQRASTAARYRLPTVLSEVAELVIEDQLVHVRTHHVRTAR